MKHRMTVVPNVDINLRDYGILLPLLDSRVQQVLEILEKDSLTSKVFQKTKISINPKPVSWQEVSLVHTKSYVQRLKEFPDEAVIKAYDLLDNQGRFQRYDPSLGRYGFSRMVDQVRLACGGVYESAKLAIQDQFCFHLHSYAGAHHAMGNRGQGFCLINDIMITARMIQRDFAVRKVWIIDVDAHRGDGTSEISRNDKSIETLSIHMKEGWPMDEKSADHHIPSSIDIPIGRGEERLYLEKLQIGLHQLQNIGIADLAIVVNGSDPYVEDALPGSSLMQLSQKQLLQRDVMIYDFLKKREIPQLWLMAGGYGDEVYKIYLQFLKHILSFESDIHSH